ncbi:hypothetical protein RvY_03181 [Ramazzottius varieornatus]|uniref:G-protein coupled receptors family 1 profile domain-containing protein n=1 Tax=Ramazzottius varieornatus TaxID=947166 RepID=A0A1D1UXD0_RAMVA|nr:hypothetical protein RvY_03181 [Ramazzottius varieornatus]
MDHERIYNIFMLLLMFILPSALMFTCYLYVYRTINTVQNLPDDLEQYALTNSLPENSSSSFEPQTRARVFTNSALEPQMRTRVFSMGQASRSSIQTWSKKYNSHNGPANSSISDCVDHEVCLSQHIHLRSSEGIYVMLDDTFERDLRIFSTIALTFIIMCLPYISFTLWYLIDSVSHGQVHPLIQELPYVLVTANTLFIPAVYSLKLCVTD